MLATCEQKDGWEADGHQYHHQPVGPRRYLEHVKENVYRIQDEPAHDQVEDPDPDNVAVLQLIKESKLNCRVVRVH